MATSLHGKLEEQLTCSVCLEQFKNPKALPCLHSFCHNCLLKIIKNGKITCPECRKSLEIVDPPDISFLPSNFIVNNILKTISDEKYLEKEAVKCDNCDTESAEYQCGVCNLVLCRPCSESHMLDEKTHSILPLDEVDTTVPTTVAREDVGNPGCSKHNKVLNVFCTSCQTVICEVCVLETIHEDHEFLPIDDITENGKDEIHNLLEKVKNKKVKLSKQLSLLKSKEEAILTKKEMVIPEIIHYFDTLTQLIERRKIELIDQATSLFHDRQKELVAPREYLEVSLIKCDNVIEATETIFNQGNEVLNQKASILKCLNSLDDDFVMPLTDDSIGFVAEYSHKEVGEKILQHCYVMKEVASPENCTASFKNPNKSIQVGKISALTVVCNNKYNQAIKGQLITPIFTGVKVKDVSVCDNDNGTYDTKFTAQEVGTVNFQVLINGRTAQRCCLSKKITWALRESIGTGLLSDGGLTLSGDRASGSWCFRVGDCSFETGVYTWKVEIKYCGGHSRLSFKKEVEIGVIDCEGDLLPGGHTKKWTAKCSAEVVAMVKLNMVHHVVNIQFTGGVNERNRSIAPTQYTFDITANKVCPYVALQGKHLSLTIKQSLNNIQ